MTILSCSTVCHIPDFDMNYYAVLISILDSVLFHGSLDFDSTKLNFCMDKNFDLVFDILLEKDLPCKKRNQNNLKSTSDFWEIDTSSLLWKISFPSEFYKNHHPSYNHDHWLQVGNHLHNNIRILLVDYGNYVRRL